MQLGYIMRTPRGRMVTQAAYDHLGIKKTDKKECNTRQMKLF